MNDLAPTPNPIIEFLMSGCHSVGWLPIRQTKSFLTNNWQLRNGFEERLVYPAREAASIVA